MCAPMHAGLCVAALPRRRPSTRSVQEAPVYVKLLVSTKDCSCCPSAAELWYPGHEEPCRASNIGSSHKCGRVVRSLCNKSGKLVTLLNASLFCDTRRARSAPPTHSAPTAHGAKAEGMGGAAAHLRRPRRGAADERDQQGPREAHSVVRRLPGVGATRAVALGRVGLGGRVRRGGRCCAGPRRPLRGATRRSARPVPPVRPSLTRWARALAAFSHLHRFARWLFHEVPLKRALLRPRLLGSRPPPRPPACTCRRGTREIRGSRGVLGAQHGPDASRARRACVSQDAAGAPEEIS
jgi:hypothetical protein